MFSLLQMYRHLGWWKSTNFPVYVLSRDCLWPSLQCLRPAAVPNCGLNPAPESVMSTTEHVYSEHKCTKPGIFKHEEDCHKFWLCKEQKTSTKLKVCVEGKLIYFDLWNFRDSCMSVHQAMCSAPPLSAAPQQQNAHQRQTFHILV